MAARNDDRIMATAIQPYENVHTFGRTCECPDYKINCQTAKEWIKSQLGVWQFAYEKRDIRDKTIHPATFPIALAKQCVSLFTHEGELVVDCFSGSGTTLIAASDLHRNCIGFDINSKYVKFANERVGQEPKNGCAQKAIRADARTLDTHLADNSVKLVITSPPYAQTLNRPRLNKSRRTTERQNDQFLKVEQYSQDKRDLGILETAEYTQAMTEIFSGLRAKLVDRGHVVINVADIWWNSKRLPLHTSIIDGVKAAGLEFKNTIIWDRTNIVNRIGIFGWPSNYITMGTTFEYLLHFEKR
jgi:DNA modification methylase